MYLLLFFFARVPQFKYGYQKMAHNNQFSSSIIGVLESERIRLGSKHYYPLSYLANLNKPTYILFSTSVSSGLGS